MVENYVRHRHKLHELVKGGEILNAVKEEGQYHGFSEFPIKREGRDSWLFRVGTIYNKDETHPRPVRLIKSLLNVGGNYARLFYDISKNDDEMAARGIEFDVKHEGGHKFRPKNSTRINGKTPPWSGDEIANAQIRKGKDFLGLEAYIEQESQADLYAFVKYHEGRTLDELKEGIAERVWRQVVYPNYDGIKKHASESHKGSLDESIRCFVETDDGGHIRLLKPQIIKEITELVIKVNERYQSKLNAASKYAKC